MRSGGGRCVGVVGAGTMGAGIAGLAARRGLAVVLYDIGDAPLAVGLDRIEAALSPAVSRGSLAASQADEARARVATTSELGDLAACDVIVEAVPERADLKGEVLSALADASPDAVLASNTSSIAIADLAQRSSAADRVVGLHFFNPPAAMRLVELVSTERTDAGAVQRARSLAEALGKEVVLVADGPGFLVNRCARPYYLEALRIVEDGAASIAQVDRVCVEDGGFPLGPFELMDVIGIDVSLAVTRSMWEQSFGEPRWRPSPLQLKMVGAGRLGHKTGAGFYGAGDHWADEPPADEWLRSEILERIVAQLVNEAAFAEAAGVAVAADIDRALVVGLNHPRGPGAWAEELGRDRLIAVLDTLWDREHDPRYRVAPQLRRAAERSVGGSRV